MVFIWRRHRDRRTHAGCERRRSLPGPFSALSSPSSLSLLSSSVSPCANPILPHHRRFPSEKRGNGVPEIRLGDHFQLPPISASVNMVTAVRRSLSTLIRNPPATAWAGPRDMAEGVFLRSHTAHN